MKKVVLSLGGSVINPGKINLSLLRKVRKLAEKHQLFIVCGGGAVSRQYGKAASTFTSSLDHIGMAATRLHAELVRGVLGSLAYKEVVSRPKKIRTRKSVVICGDKVGHSSDYDAVVWASLYNTEVINITNVDYVYDKDPSKKGAKPLKGLTWKEYFKIVGNDFKSNGHYPFDPVSGKLAQKKKVRVVVINGQKFSRVEKYLGSGKLVGSVIQ